MLLVEQHPANALRVADRGVVLRRGRVELDGAAPDLLARLDEIEGAYLAQDFSRTAPDQTGAAVPSAT